MKRLVYTWAHIIYVEGQPRTEHLFDLRSSKIPKCPKPDCGAPSSEEYWKVNEQMRECVE